MSSFLEVWKPAGVELCQLSTDRATVGRGKDNQVSVPDDGQMSRLHAVLERVGDSWIVRDLSSRNGTFVNGDRLAGDRPLRAGDEIRVGTTRLVYRTEEVAEDMRTLGPEAPPSLTPREREVLLALFGPAVGGGVFTEPASTRQIAAALHVSEAAVKQHLLRLYDKFQIHDEGERRRVRLANEALRRGAVTMAEVRAAAPPAS